MTAFVLFPQELLYHIPIQVTTKVPSQYAFLYRISTQLPRSYRTKFSTTSPLKLLYHRLTLVQQPDLLEEFKEAECVHE